MSSSTSFEKVRSFLWPIHANELKKILPLLIVSFLLSFNYNLLKATKDAIIVPVLDKGVETIPFIKIFLILPLSILFFYLFSKMATRFDRLRRIVLITSFFMAYFALFGLVLYPWREALYLTKLSFYLQGDTAQGNGMGAIVEMIRYWPYSTFYAMSELWGAIVLNVGFWSFVNEVTKVEEAKRFYPIMGICLNFSGIAAGLVGNGLKRFAERYLCSFNQSPWETSVYLIMASVLITTVVALSTLSYLHRRTSDDPSPPVAQNAEPSPLKTNFFQDVRLLLRSPYILAIAITVFSFGFVIGATELLWKDQMRVIYSTHGDYFRFSNHISIITGVLATMLAFITGWCIRRLGWTFTALVSPILFSTVSIGFFGFLLYPDACVHLLGHIVDVDVVKFAAFSGVALTSLSRTAKYTLFDATKELAFIPLDRKTKLQGKAAIDGVGSRLGKASASVLYPIFFYLPGVGTLAATTPYIAICCFITLCMWISAVLYLGKRFKQLTA